MYNVPTRNKKWPTFTEVIFPTDSVTDRISFLDKERTDAVRAHSVTYSMCDLEQQQYRHLRTHRLHIRLPRLVKAYALSKINGF